MLKFIDTWKSQCAEYGPHDGCIASQQLAITQLGRRDKWLANEVCISMLEGTGTSTGTGMGVGSTTRVPKKTVPADLQAKTLTHPLAVSILNLGCRTATFEHRMLLVPSMKHPGKAWRLQSFKVGSENTWHSNSNGVTERLPEATLVDTCTVLGSLCKFHTLGWDAALYNDILGFAAVPVDKTCKGAYPFVVAYVI